MKEQNSGAANLDAADIALALAAERAFCVKNYANGGYVVERCALRIAKLLPESDVPEFLKACGIQS